MNSLFYSKLESLWGKNKYLCIGLDSDYQKIPDIVKKGKSQTQSIVSFNQQIVDAAADFACCFKPNSAFYEGFGAEGWKALSETIAYIKKNYPEVVVILDAKRADIGNTNEYYAKSVFDDLNCDAITVHPYLGKEAMLPFLNRKDKGIIVLVKTSNTGSGEFQDLILEDKEPIYQKVAKNISENWNDNGNCAVVVGATYPNELKNVRDIVGDMPILIPGIGVQGGDLKATVEAGRAKNNWGMMINSSRGIIFASPNDDFAQAAKNAALKLNDEIKSLI